MEFFSRRGRIPGRAIAALLLLLALLATANFFWLRANKTPPSWDQSAHLTYSLEFHDLFKSWHPLRAERRSFFIQLMRVSNYWPPFFHISTVPVTLLFGFSPDTVTATQILYLIVLAFSVYAIGAHFLTPGLGVAAAALTLLFPIIYGLSRTQLLDLPLTAMVALVQALILKTRAGTRWQSAWMLGLAAGLCIMTKWTGPVFFAGTFLLVLVPAWKTKAVSRRSMILSLFIVALVASAVVVPWFRLNWAEFAHRMGDINIADAARLGSPAPFSPQAFGWYIFRTAKNLLTWPLLPFALLGAAGWIVWFRKRRFLAFLACWIVPSYLVFVGVPVKDDRFIVPFLPALALFIVAGIGALPKTVLRKAAMAALFLVAVAEFFMFSFAWPVRMTSHFSFPPSADRWPIAEILEAVDAEFGTKTLTVGVLPALPYFNAPVFQYFNRVAGYPYHIRDVGATRITRQLISDCDLLVLKNANLTVRGTAVFREEFFEALKQRTGRAYGFFDWKHFRLPDRTNAYIFVKERLRK